MKKRNGMRIAACLYTVFNPTQPYIQPNTTIHSFFFRNGIEFLFFYLPLEKHFFLFLLELFYSICVGMLNGQ